MACAIEHASPLEPATATLMIDVCLYRGGMVVELDGVLYGRGHAPVFSLSGIKKGSGDLAALVGITESQQLLVIKIERNLPKRSL